MRDYKPTSGVGKHAKKEIEFILGNKNEEYIIEPFKNEIIQLCDKFGKSGQSGGSAPYTAAVITAALEKLLLYENISPITGEDNEWTDVSHYMGGITYQNNRVSSIFKDSDNQAYYLNAIIWQGDTPSEDGSIGWETFSGKVEGITSRQYIKEFPFEPKTFYIDVTREYCGSDDEYTYRIKHKDQLDEVFAYYDIYGNG